MAALTITLFIAPKVAWGLGFQLSETKEELKLMYDVSVSDPDNGRVTIELNVTDFGRLGPGTFVEFGIPSEDGTGFYDLSVRVEMIERDGKSLGRVHLKKEWARRGSLHLVTYKFDGKAEPLTHYYFLIPVAELIKTAESK